MKELVKKIFTKKATTGWIIFGMGFWFGCMAIDPLMNDTEQFLRITGMVLGGGVCSTVLIMWLLELTLPTEKKYQNVKKAKKLLKELKGWSEYSDIAYDAGAQREYIRIENELKQLEIKQ